MTHSTGGTPDPDDVTADGRVDLSGSVFRELQEETGLAAADVAADGGFMVRTATGLQAVTSSEISVRPASSPLQA